MKVKVDNEQIFELSETQKKVIKNDINEDVFESDMKRRLHYILNHKFERCFERLKQEWEPKLISAGVKMFPADKEAFAELVFSHPEYKSRKQRDENA